jgi:hypothetical protein
MRSSFGYWFLTTLFAASAAFAQTSGRPGEISKIRANCGSELQRFCPGVEPGGGRIIQCLLSHRGSLAAACRSVLVAARSEPGVAPTPTRQSMAPLSLTPPIESKAATGQTIHASCGGDVQRLCAGVPKEGHGVVKCLASHRTELSATCRSFFQELRAREAAQKTAHANNPPPPAAPINRGPAAAAAGSNIRASCGGDVQRLCAGVPRKDHGVVKCLISHRPELSASCRSFFQEMRARRAEQKSAGVNNPPPVAPIHATPAGGQAGSNIRASCGGDVQRLCAGVPKEDHGVIKCLISHRPELSATCRSFLQELRARRAAQ